MGVKVKIRRATAYDVVDLTLMLERGAEEQGNDIWYPRPSSNAGNKIGYVLTMIERGLVFIAQAIETDENGSVTSSVITGAIGMAFAKDGWSDDMVLQNEWFYVTPEWRASKVADSLLTAVERFADGQIDPVTGQRVGIPMIMGLITGKDAELKEVLMRRRGYQSGGANFVRAPTDVEQQENDDDEPDSVMA